MRQIAEIKFDHIDEEENIQSVDIFFTDDDNEEGTVACEVCLDTGKVFYRDNIYRAYDEVKEAIKEIRKTIEKKPVTVIKVQEGRVTDVISNTDQEFIVADLDVECCEEDRLTYIKIRERFVRVSIETDFEIEIKNKVSEEVISQLDR